MSIKRKITDNFDRGSNSYETVAHIQKESSNLLVEQLQEFIRAFYPQTILDIGTGTGYIPEILLSYYPESFYMLSDIAPRMIEVVKNKFAGYPNFAFLEGDIENILIEDYDLIISNFALQWAENLELTLKKLYSKSKIFAFTCLLEGTFDNWYEILRNYGLMAVLSQYPSEQSLVSWGNMMNAGRFYSISKEFQLKFDSYYTFMKYLKRLGAGASGIIIPPHIIKSLLKKDVKEFVITYKVFFGILEK